MNGVRFLSKIAVAAGFALALAFVPSHSSSGESYAAARGCRWSYKLQHDWLVPGSEYAKQVHANAAAEARINPNCPEVIWEARQKPSNLSGESYAAVRGCKWSYKLQHDWLVPGSEYDEQVRANAAVESLSNYNCAEVIR